MKKPTEGKKENQCGQATPEEIKEHNRKCWWTGCNKTSRLENMGWRYCFYHSWYRWESDYNFSLKNLYYFLKWHKLIFKH